MMDPHSLRDAEEKGRETKRVLEAGGAGGGARLRAWGEAGAIYRLFACRITLCR